MAQENHAFENVLEAEEEIRRPPPIFNARREIETLKSEVKSLVSITKLNYHFQQKTIYQMAEDMVKVNRKLRALSQQNNYLKRVVKRLKSGHKNDNGYSDISSECCPSDTTIVLSDSEEEQTEGEEQEDISTSGQSTVENGQDGQLEKTGNEVCSSPDRLSNGGLDLDESHIKTVTVKGAVKVQNRAGQSIRVEIDDDVCYFSDDDDNLLVMIN